MTGAPYCWACKGERCRREVRRFRAEWRELRRELSAQSRALAAAQYRRRREERRCACCGARLVEVQVLA